MFSGCGNLLGPALWQGSSSGPRLYINFFSDGKNTFDGYALQYSCVSIPIFTMLEGSISSGGEGGYKSNQRLTRNINCPAGFMVSASFSKFDIEDSR